MRIGPYLIDPPIGLAPMAGVTDKPFRQLCKKLGAGLAVSEMTTSDPRLWTTRKSLKRMDHAGELRTHRAIRTQQRTHVERAGALSFHVRLAGRDHRAVDGGDISGVEVDPLIHYREVGTHAKRIALRLQRRSRGDQPGRGGSDKRTTGNRHVLYCVASPREKFGESEQHFRVA